MTRTPEAAVSRPRTRWHLSPVAKVRLASEIVAAYVRVRYLLWRYPEFPAALARVRRKPSRPKDFEGRKELEAALGLGNAVIRTLRVLPTDSRCLMRSIVLTALLTRRRIDSKLIIGVRGAGDDFAAHAWVEYDGIAVLPATDDFARLTEL
jgi:hypothetical protein